MSIWQSKVWWKMLIESKQAEKIFEIDKIFIEKRKVSMWEYGLFILWIDKELKENEILEIINICKKEKCLFVQIENIDYNLLQIWENINSNFCKNIELKINNNQFKKWYYKKFITPFTAVIDLSLTEEQILSNMKPKWRYNIKLAEKKWLIAKIVEKIDENIAKFYDLMNETTKRDGFNWNTYQYYKIFLENLENSKLILVYLWENVIAWWIFVFEKEVSIYYYWASSSNIEFRNLMAPYSLQWEAIKYAKSIWSKIYDFLWVATLWEKNSPLEWVTDFKLKLTKDVVNVSDSYIWINKKFKYKLINFLRKFK